MLKHVSITYETVDGLIFTDEEAAYLHENMMIYKRSGFRFYRGKRQMIKNVEQCYDEADYFTLDHSKEEANREFLEMAYYFYGWIFPDDILGDKDAKRFRYNESNSRWESVSRKKVSDIK